MFHKTKNQNFKIMFKKTKKKCRVNSPFCAFALSALCFLLFAFLPLASQAQTIPDDIFGNYAGDVRVTCTLAGFDETASGVAVELKNLNSENYYAISVPELDLMGIGLPVELDSVLINTTGTGYELTRASAISFVIKDVPIPEISIPGPPPITLPAGNYDVSFKVILGKSEIIEYTLNLNFDVTASLTILLYGFPITIPVPFNVAFNGVHEIAVLPPVITTTDLPSGIENQAYYALLEATGETPITWSIIDGDLPTGLTLDPLTGAISGSPTEVNIFSFTVQAENIGGIDTRVLSIEIAPVVLPPVIITTSLPSGIVNQEYNALLEATGITPITWLLMDGDLPTGLTLDPLTGVISGIPTEANTFNFTIVAENYGGTSFQPLSIIIEEDTVGISTPIMEAFKVYPNPTSDALHVTSDVLQVKHIEIFDIYGKLHVSRVTCNENKTPIDISQLPAGVYIIKIQTDKGAYKQQFIKK